MNDELKEMQWLGRQCIRFALAAIKEGYPGMNPEIMARGILIEESQSIPDIGYRDFWELLSTKCGSIDMGNAHLLVSRDDKSTIENS